MRPLATLSAQRAGRLSGLIFDLDGTILSDGALSLEAYTALHALGRSGLRLVACTGRSCSWGEVVQRQWPLDLTVVENGAISYQSEGGRLLRHDALSRPARQSRRTRLRALAEGLRTQFHEIPLADDNLGRLSDVTFDVGERAKVPAERVRELRKAAEALGARTFESSIHVHLTFDTDTKASGTIRALARCFGEDSTAALGRYAYVGDSLNDESCFGAFRMTFGVANIKPFLPRFSRQPEFGSEAACGAGFVEIANRLVALRMAR